MATVPWRLLPMGEAALLVETDSVEGALALEAALAAAATRAKATAATATATATSAVWREVDDLVPAARTVLVQARPSTDLVALRRAVSAALSEALLGESRCAGALVEIPVSYDGPDLEEVARHTGLSVDEVVRAHTAQPWTVGFCGFAPGFAYLVGGDTRLAVPRRASPRTRVPAGAVALAGEFSAVYPRASPGGWQLIGSTDAALWDLARREPALLRPGMRVRFVRTEHPRRPAAPPVPRDVAVTGSALEVLASGPLALVQDGGRVGRMAIGVGRSGAADHAAYALGNRLVGNRRRAASLEATLGGLRLRARGSQTLCLTGALAPASIDGVPVAYAALVHLADGAELVLGTPREGLRTYVSVRGGIGVRPEVGSRSTDTMSGLGPPPLTAGQVLPVGRAVRRHPVVDHAPVVAPSSGVVTLRVSPGPRRDWFADPAALASARWRVSGESDRRGIRLRGGGLERAAGFVERELPSEGTVRGAIQVPPSGQPVVLLNDHPVTGGYPVIGVVLDADTDRAAQLAPGQEVRFRWVD